MLCQHGSAVDKTHWCNIKSVLATSTEHSAVWAAVGPIPGSPVHPRQTQDTTPTMVGMV